MLLFNDFVFLFPYKANRNKVAATQGNRYDSRKMVIVVSSTTSLIVMLLIFITFFCWRRKTKSKLRGNFYDCYLHITHSVSVFFFSFNIREMIFFINDHFTIIIKKKLNFTI